MVPLDRLFPQGTNRVFTAWNHIVRPRNGVVGYRDDRSIVFPESLESERP
jgi:hypothetical protein